MTTISLTNPWTKVDVEQDITGLTQAQLDAYTPLMDEDTIEAVSEATADGTDVPPETWLAAWVKRVGPVEAGRVIFGS